MRDYEPKYSKCLCSELTFTNKKWICFSIYRPPESINLSTFFEELTTSLSNAVLEYENLLIMGDFNIGMKSKSSGYDKLDEFCELFNHRNLIKSETCFTKNYKSLIDLFLTNTPTGLSDYHKPIKTFKIHFSRLRPKVLSYRNYKNFNESKFLNDLSKTIVTFDNEVMMHLLLINNSEGKQNGI